jgi:hypothetical protein
MSTKIDFFGATGHDHGSLLMAAAPETEAASTAEAAATSTAEAAAVVWWQRYRQGNIGTTMMATTGDKDFNLGRASHCCQQWRLVIQQ